MKKLTIMVSEDVYTGLYNTVGARNIGRFIESAVRPHLLMADLDASYAAMAADEEREAEALEWADALIGDVADDPR